MYTVKQWESIGVSVIVGDKCKVGECISLINLGDICYYKKHPEHCDECYVLEFTPRKNTGTQPAPNGVMVDIELKDGTLMSQKDAKYISWELNANWFSELREVITWKPSLTQPLIYNQKESEMSEQSEIHKAWVALNGDFNNMPNRISMNSNQSVGICLIGDKVFKEGEYTNAPFPWFSSYWKVICTIQEFTHYCEMMREKRMDIIGQNVNDGLHYDNTAQQVEALASDSKPVFTQAMADANELPPVGSEVKLVCNYKSKAFIQGTALFASNTYCIVNTSKGEEVKCMTEYSYLPIQSPRDKGINELMLTCVTINSKQADEIYKSGYRKLTTEHAKMYDDKTQFFGEDY